jgi:hypothetical protein
MQIELWMSTDLRNTQLNLHVFIFKTVNVRNIVSFTKCESDQKIHLRLIHLRERKLVKIFFNFVSPLSCEIVYQYSCRYLKN